MGNAWRIGNVIAVMYIAASLHFPLGEYWSKEGLGRSQREAPVCPPTSLNQSLLKPAAPPLSSRLSRRKSSVLRLDWTRLEPISLAKEIRRGWQRCPARAAGCTTCLPSTRCQTTPGRALTWRRCPPWSRWCPKGPPPPPALKQMTRRSTSSGRWTHFWCGQGLNGEKLDRPT